MHDTIVTQLECERLEDMELALITCVVELNACWLQVIGAVVLACLFGLCCHLTFSLRPKKQTYSNAMRTSQERVSTTLRPESRFEIGPRNYHV